jgi:hypothetical protein
VELPRAIAQWKSELAIFPDDVALKILPWLPKLALALGPFAASSTQGDGPPDGFGGLSRRGKYERLLMSEWLLATEMPDEFVRRAAMGEHAFLELAKRQPQGSKRCIALFDAGPSQHGAPRIAHLALMIVLHRRARVGGADFFWGVLQEPDGWLHDEVSKTSVLALLRSRSPHESSLTDCGEWLERFGGAKTADDVWVIGGARTKEMSEAHRVRRVQVDDLLTVDERSVRVLVHKERTIAPPIDLRLPEERLSVRLLRDPFEVIVPPPAPRIEPGLQGSNLVYSADGRKLFVKTADGKVVAFQAPGSPAERLSHPRKLDPNGHGVIAAGFFHRAYTLVASDTKRIFMHSYSPRGNQTVGWTSNELPTGFPIWHSGARTPLMPVIPLRYVDPARPQPRWEGALFLDGVGRLFWIHPWARLPVLIHHGVTALGQWGGAIAIVVNSEAAWSDDKPRVDGPMPRYVVSFMRPTADKQNALWEPLPIDLEGSQGDLQAFFAERGRLLVVRIGESRWRTFQRHFGPAEQRPASQDLEPFAGTTVVGAAIVEGRPSLYLLESAKSEISLLGRSLQRTVVTEDEPITFACGSPSGLQLAYITESGRVMICFPGRGTTIRIAASPFTR